MIDIFLLYEITGLAGSFAICLYWHDTLGLRGNDIFMFTLLGICFGPLFLVSALGFIVLQLFTEHF